MNTVAGKERRDPVLKGVGDKAEAKSAYAESTNKGRSLQEAVSLVWPLSWLGRSLLEAVSLWFVVRELIVGSSVSLVCG